MHTQSDILDKIQQLLDGGDFAGALAESERLLLGGAQGMPDADLGRLNLLAAHALYRLGRLVEALQRSSDAIEKLRHSDAHGEYGRAKCQRGHILVYLGEIPQAAEEFREALSAFKRIGDSPGQLECYHCLAKCEYYQGQYRKAEEYLQKKLVLSEESSDETAARNARANLGRVYLLMGELGKADELLALESADLVYLTPVTKCTRLLSLGYLALLRRSFPQASRYLEQAKAIAGEYSLTRETGIYHEYSGELAFWQGNQTVAEGHYREAIRIGAGPVSVPSMICQTSRLLAELQVEQGKLADAAESCDRAWAVAEMINEQLELGAIQRVRGQIAAKRSEAAAAKAAFDESIRILGEIGAKYELARAHLLAGEAECLDTQFRLTNLFAARGLFEKIGVEYWKERVAAQIDKLIRSEVGRTPLPAPPRGIGFAGDGHAPFIAVSRPMREILDIIDRIKNTDATVLLLGETGVGKDHLAQHIHFASDRADKPFENICTTAIPESLWESEFFGQKKGAFTGAQVDRPGRLERANGGTVYLNEIAELPLHVQAKLLDVLESKQVRRLGDWRTVKLDIRFIAASNRDLQAAVRAGRFREDLFHRLNQMPLHIPPLRERRVDISALAAHILSLYDFPVPRTTELLAPPFRDLLEDAPWPGNVRQMQHVLWRLTTLGNGANADDMVALGRQILAGEGLLVDPEREKLIATLKANDWNQRQTAREMGISEASLRRAITRLGLHRSNGG